MPAVDDYAIGLYNHFANQYSTNMGQGLSPEQQSALLANCNAFAFQLKTYADKQVLTVAASTLVVGPNPVTGATLPGNITAP